MNKYQEPTLPTTTALTAEKAIELLNGLIYSGELPLTSDTLDAIRLAIQSLRYIQTHQLSFQF